MATRIDEMIGRDGVGGTLCRESRWKIRARAKQKEGGTEGG